MKSAIAALVVVVVVGAAAAQESELVLRTYDVSALTETRAPTHGPVLGPLPRDRVELPEPDQTRRAFEGEFLCDLIRARVAPDSWDQGGEIEYRENEVLVVRNSPAVLGRIETLLAEAQMVASRRVLLTVTMLDVPRDHYASVAAGASPLTGGEKPAYTGTRLLESASAEVRPGVRQSLRILNRVDYVRDYDVEIAQGSNISDPIADSAYEGLAVDFVAHPTLDGSRVVIETILQQGAFDRPMRTQSLALDEEYFPQPFRSDRRTGLGEIQLPRYGHVNAVSTDVVRSGGSFTIPILGRERLRLLLVKAVVLGWEGGANFIDCGALAHRSQAYFFGYSPEVEDDEHRLVAPLLLGDHDGRSRVFGSRELLTDIIFRNLDPDYWDEAGAIEVVQSAQSLLLVTADEEKSREVRRLLLASEKETIRPVRMDLRVYSVAGPVRAGAKRTFAAEGARLVQAGAVASLPGRCASLMSGNTQNFIADYDVEVAQEARISDPTIGQRFDGLVANLTPRLSFDRARLSLELEVLISHGGQVRPFDTETQFLGPVEEVDEKRTILDTSVELAAGDLYVLDAGPDPADAERRLAVVVRASW